MNKSDKITSIPERFFMISGNIIFILALCILLATDEQGLRSRSNLALFAFDLLILAGLCIRYIFSRKKGRQEWKHPLMLLTGGYLFLLQCLYTHYTYFYAGWDVGLMQIRAVPSAPITCFCSICKPHLQGRKTF